MGSVHRVPAIEIETIVSDAVRRELQLLAGADADLIKTHVVRVEVQPHRLVVELMTPQTEEATAESTTVYIPWQKPPSKRRREIIAPHSATRKDARPIRADARARLVAAIAQARRWLDELVAGTVTDIEAIASRERCSVRKVNMTISLAFLAPDLVKAAIEGRLPRGVGIARLCDQPAEWSSQYLELGLANG